MARLLCLFTSRNPVLYIVPAVQDSGLQIEMRIAKRKYAGMWIFTAASLAERPGLRVSMIYMTRTHLVSVLDNAYLQDASRGESIRISVSTSWP